MGTDENKTIVRRLFDEVCNGRRLEVADELIATTHIHHDPSSPDAGPGPEGIKHLVSIYQGAFSDAHWTVEGLIAEGDMVAARWTGSGTNDAELQGMPPTGKQVTVPGAWTFRLADGKVVESWNVWDTLGMLHQLGVIPTPEQATI